MGNTRYFLSGDTVHSDAGRLDPWQWRWEPADLPAGAKDVSAREALAAATRGGKARRVPVGIIGPRAATDAQYAGAEEIGAALGALGLTVMCGGKSGVMEAAAKGCLGAGGLSVGLVPDHDWRCANDYIALPIATGLSEARNMIIAKSCAVLVAVGGSYGTLSEIAYGLHFSKPVIGLLGAPDVEGLEMARDPQDAVERLAGHVMAMATSS
ncbi:TIGR00725 family protein [Stappia sp. ICDLI1TA098]